MAAWLWRIARNVRIDQLRKQDFDPDAMEEEPADPSNNPELRADTDALRSCVARGYQQFRAKFPERAIALSWLVTDNSGGSGSSDRNLVLISGVSAWLIEHCDDALRQALI